MVKIDAYVHFLKTLVVRGPETMGVICFASLKGGVGKTTLSLSVANALAQRGCQTLLIDLDPAEHASRFFHSAQNGEFQSYESPLARLFLASDVEEKIEELGGVIEAAMASSIPMVVPARPRFALLPSGPELRHFFWGKGAQMFKTYFPKLLDELNSSYDYVVIDTPPDYNVLTRNSIASSDLVVVPVDTGAMSIHCLENLVNSCSHIEGPTWSILRTMVNRQASRIQKLSTERLQQNLSLRSSSEFDEEDDERFVDADVENPDVFISLLEQHEQDLNGNKGNGNSAGQNGDGSPIYLLNSILYRTEQQNRLTFLGKTAFDERATAKLAEHYTAVARELEQILSLKEESESLMPVNDFLPETMERIQAS